MTGQDNLSEKVLNVGDEVTATVVKLEEKQVVVNIGAKFDGIIPISELSHLHVDHTNEVLSEGDEFQAVVTKLEDDVIILSKKAKDHKVVWEQLLKVYDEEEVLDAIVTEVVGAGLIVDVGIRGFIPASHIETFYVDDLEKYKGKQLSVKIIEINEERNRVILSHKAVAESEQERKKEQLFNQLEVGNVVEGVVQRIASFGVFVDLGGVDGLVHISQLSHDHIEKAEDVVEVGQTVKVKVITVDRDTERIGLSIKDLQPGPWAGVEKQLKSGNVVEGTVKRLVNFGAFVEVLPQVEGLVHISEISKDHIETPQEVLSVGQSVKVKVLDVSEEEQRISLSIKEVEEEEENKEMQKYQKEDDESAFQIGDLIGDQLKDFNK
ncbi:small subunit ribosomal protein S1 [Alkalibacillus filiformis]|uniref:Small subunit ribosomal protein S1 n=1 Tax=Alkalibacillus filiformis TaxID=200990 RepID=A0ABU0DR76_9BACI|nr:30S ribosomal protein S1 [Alkalibacillus filiformis]MDQ0350870.1 small subunit ribosomal protein S1 [Alkalibacillus filiformis]